MNRVANFEKVSFEQFKLDYIDTFGEEKEEVIKKLYDSIKLPKRATSKSAGYDFYTYTKIKLDPNKTIKYPTGIRARIDDDFVLMIAPRSSLGFKYRLQLDNTIGVIDADYYNAKNEGHIFIKVTNDSRTNKSLELNEGDAFAQGIFLMYGITLDDEADGVRVGGFGSTNK